MNFRERFVNNLLFKEADGVTLYESGFFEETVNRWYREGLPTGVLFRQAGLFPISAGASGRYILGGGVSIYEYFNFDPIEALPIDYGPIPKYVLKVLKETEKYRIERDEYGIKRKVLKYGATVAQYLDFPVKTHEDWELMKERFDPYDPFRYPSWDSEHIEFYETADFILGTWWPGLYWQTRFFLGDIPLITNIYRDPKFIHEIMDFWTDFLIETARKALKEIKIDYMLISEDMCYNKGMFISPKQFRDFMLPNYKKISSFLKSHGVPIIMLDTDGNANDLIPLLIEAGFNAFNPIEVQANMDVVELHRKFNKKIGLFGGIDKRNLSRDKKAIENELKTKEEVFNEGGYIPACDHKVPPEVPYENYKFYVKKLREYCRRE